MTTEPKWTPGPWYLTGDDDLRYVREEASDAVLARIEDGGHVDPQFALPATEQLANANLIAAAPALYEAAEKARIKLARYREQHGDSFIGGVAAEYDAVVAVIDAALKAARGEKL